MKLIVLATLDMLWWETRWELAWIMECGVTTASDVIVSVYASHSHCLLIYVLIILTI